MKKLLVTLALLSTTLVLAGEERGPRGDNDRQPPQEAIEVCEGQSEGASCKMTTRRGDTVDGTCENTPDGKYFACKPEDMRRR